MIGETRCLRGLSAGLSVLLAMAPFQDVLAQAEGTAQPSTLEDADSQDSPSRTSVSPSVSTPTSSNAELKPAPVQTVSDLAPSQSVPRSATSKAPFTGVGLMLTGGLLAAVSFYPAFFGAMDWLWDDPVLGMGEPESAVEKSRNRGRTLFLVGSVGLVVGGGLFVGGVVLHQRYLGQKNEFARGPRVRPLHAWTGRTHVMGVQGRF